MKLPAGVLVLRSLARPTPAEPRNAPTGVPTRRQPPLTLVHLCKVAVVLEGDAAVTVTTWSAPAVLKSSGSRRAEERFGVDGAALGFDLVGVFARVGAAVVFGAGVAGADVEAGGVGAVEIVPDVVAELAPAEFWAEPVRSPEQPAPARQINAAATTADRAPMQPGCHVTPMRILGWADGVSQRIRDVSLLCEMATQPAVDRPSVTCRKKALPLPAWIPPGALRVL